MLDQICIVDDDPIFIYTTKRTIKLSKISASLLVFFDGKEAYDSLLKMADENQELPDLILLDINMPVWDAWTFLDKFTVRDFGKRIVIYVVSSSINKADTEKAKDYKDVENYLIKPISVEELEDAVSEDFPDMNL